MGIKLKIWLAVSAFALLAVGVLAGYLLDMDIALSQDIFFGNLGVLASLFAVGLLLLCVSYIWSLFAMLQARRHYKQAHDHFETLSVSGPLMLCRFDREGTLQYVNKPYSEYLGKPAEQLLGSNAFAYVEPCFHEEIGEQMALRTPEDCNYTIDLRVYRHDGQLRWTRWYTRSLFDSKGEISVIHTLGVDIHEQKEFEQAFARSQAEKNLILENISDGVMYMDTKQEIIWANGRAGEMSGTDPEDMLGKKCYEIYSHQNSVCQDCPVATCLDNGKYCENDIVQTDGRIFHVSGVPARNENGEIIGAVETLRDVTEDKHLQHELIKARNQAISADKAKSEFLANMSHEIRTPMNGIVGMTDLVLATDLNEEQQEYVTTIRQCGESMMCVINDILDFSKIAAGKLDFIEEPFRLRETLAALLVPLSIEAAKKDVELVYYVNSDVPDLFTGDKLRLSQIINNLLSNAVKFTREGEIVVKVELEFMRDQTARLHFSVQDSGIGIDAEKLNHIFSPFEQADSSTTRSFGGTGLGLAISSRLAEMFNGRIWAKSQPSVGSSFHFTAELHCRDHSYQPQVRYGPVLIVDENITAATMLEKLLEDMGVSADICHNAAEAVGMLNSSDSGKKYDMLLADSKVDNGDMLVSALLTQQLSDLAFTVMQPAGARSQDAADALAQQAKFHLAKPVGIAALVNVLQLAGGEVVHIDEPPIESQELSPQSEERIVSELTVDSQEFDGPEKLNILLAEDNSTNQMLAVKLLEMQGHSVQIVNNGRKAVDMAVSGEFDLVLMDVQMPVLGGLEATREIRQSQLRSESYTPIIAMTAHALQGDRQQCLDAGMDGYVSKPVTGSRIASEIKRVLSAGGQHQLDAETETSSQFAELIDNFENDENILDAKEALSRLDCDEVFFAAICDAILAELDPMTESLAAAIKQGDLSQVETVSHTLRGSLANVSANAAVAATRELENAAKDLDVTAIQKSFIELKSHLALLRSRLREIVISMSESGGGVADRD